MKSTAFQRRLRPTGSSSASPVVQSTPLDRILYIQPSSESINLQAQDIFSDLSLITCIHQIQASLGVACPAQRRLHEPCSTSPAIPITVFLFRPRRTAVPEALWRQHWHLALLGQPFTRVLRRRTRGRLGIHMVSAYIPRQDLRVC